MTFTNFSDLSSDLGVLSAVQVLHGKDIICTGTLKAYNPIDCLDKEKVVSSSGLDSDKAAEAAEITGTGFDYLSSEQWYDLCKRQSLEYGPKFRRVHKKACNRGWSELKYAGPR